MDDTAAPAPAESETRRRKAKGDTLPEDREKRRRERALRPLRGKLKQLEEEIARQEARLNEIIARQADPDVYRDGERARDAAHERRAVEEKLAWMYDEWGELSGRVEEEAKA